MRVLMAALGAVALAFTPARAQAQDIPSDYQAAALAPSVPGMDR